ncbi:sugar ABC transporter ATP-binding protein [Christensenella intestinihominis]|uniref:sugar ABC transporter ATP-binding protein n=1 Tax=Christensenella intestinihominis TaxID=1851429 RepID=UPI00082F4504|nr:sugar ABC transporter ATP-binding protein [Christensenella intestinihominis]
MQTFLEIDHISKTFPGVKALSDVHFDIYPGEVHSLVGENGAGKSTLIKIMSGVYQPDEGGTIRINGKETKIHNAMDAIRQGIAVIYQDFSLFGNLSVAENIVINQVIEKNRQVLNWKEIRKKAAEALRIVGADISPLETLENLSVAKQQMVAIASAVAQKAQMIIMDEPTSALSTTEVETLYGIIEKLKAENIAVMFVSHKMDELFRISDRFTVFRDGQYIRSCKKEEIDRGGLISLMVGRKIEFDSLANPVQNPEVVLEVSHLSKKGNFKDVSFELHKGEILGITGLVGAGRSEMVQALFGLNRPDSGSVKIDGKEAHIDNTWSAVDAGIGYIPESRQTQGLVLDKSVAENIALPQLKKYTGKFGFVNRKKQKETVGEWVEKLDVRPRNEELLAMQLSGGNQQKVVLAKWIATNAKILIVDEPTNGVDVGAKSEIHKILRQLADQGTSLIVISSELPEILAVSDRILVMRRGRISGEFVNKDLTQELIMDKAVVS